MLAIMDLHQYIGTREAADLLEVGESTIKRWADQGILPVNRTVGKHRKILLSDLVRVADELNLPRAKLERLLNDRPIDTTNLETLAEQFHAGLIVGENQRTTSLLREAHAAGHRIARIGDDVICPAMMRIGQNWQSGTIDIYHEHRGTQNCLAAVQSLRALLPAADRNAPLALGGGPEGDHYQLANLLVELTLLEEGWQVDNLGPNLPHDSFVRAIRERRPRLVWLSCSHLADVELFVKGFAQLYAAANEVGAAVTVGGRALGADIRRRLTFTHHGDTLGHLATYAHGLRR
ncbi:MAG: helix-turn-helix domain-containing protein [Planctomycetia bacterium]|nr:helix-turn-helix domain-containing protein [Planctomycetia bacterium]